MFLYKNIKKALHSAYGHQEGSALKRTNKLAWMLCGTIQTGKSYLQSVGSAFPQFIDLESREAKVRRWIKSTYTDWEVSFLPCIAPILASFISKNQRMFFAIDGSDVANGCTVLMISLTIGKRAIPICWMVKECKKGHLPANMHLELFTKLKELLNGYEQVSILGDGEFDNHQVIDASNQWNWQFVFKTAKNTYLFDGRDEYKIGELAPAEGELFFTVLDVAYTKKRYGLVHATVWHDRKKDNPIYLLSNCELSFEVAKQYEKRWSIETLFGDIKSRGFNIHKSKLSKAQRVAKLLIIICLAYILLYRLGQSEKKSPLLSKIGKKQRLDLSIFSIGRKLVEICLKYQIPIIFSFSKNCFVFPNFSVR